MLPQLLRPLARRMHGACHQRRQSVSAISTLSAASVVPPGLVTASRSAAAGDLSAASSAPAPATVARASFSRRAARQAFRHRRRGQRLDQQEHIGRAGAGHGGDAVDQLFLRHPHRLAERRQQAIGALRSAAVAPLAA